MTLAVDLKTELRMLLKREYTALMSGNLDEIERLTRQKVALLQKVGALPIIELQKFDRVRPLLERNQKLAQSAIKGMRVAINRARDITEVSCNLRTYKRDGSNQSIPMRSVDAFSKRS